MAASTVSAPLFNRLILFIWSPANFPPSEKFRTLCELYLDPQQSKRPTLFLENMGFVSFHLTRYVLDWDNGTAVSDETTKPGSCFR